MKRLERQFLLRPFGLQHFGNPTTGGDLRGSYHDAADSFIFRFLREFGFHSVVFTVALVHFLRSLLVRRLVAAAVQCGIDKLGFFIKIFFIDKKSFKRKNETTLGKPVVST